MQQHTTTDRNTQRVLRRMQLRQHLQQLVTQKKIAEVKAIALQNGKEELNLTVLCQEMEIVPPPIGSPEYLELVFEWERKYYLDFAECRTVQDFRLQLMRSQAA